MSSQSLLLIVPSANKASAGEKTERERKTRVAREGMSCVEGRRRRSRIVEEAGGAARDEGRVAAEEDKEEGVGGWRG